MTQSFKKFRTRAFRDQVAGFRHGRFVLREKYEEDKEAERQTRADLSALLELRDIVDELTTMQKLFEQQKEAILEMEIQYRAHYGAEGGHGVEYLEEALASLEEFMKQTSEMMTNAKTAQDAVS